MNNLDKKFLLLQVNDALFPIGAYSHSYGLETYIQKNCITTVDEAEEFLKNRLLYGLTYNELLSIKLAYMFALKGDTQKLRELEDILQAGRIPQEIREAGNKLGSRFLKTLSALDLEYEKDIFYLFCQSHAKEPVQHSIAYGVFCAAAGVELEEALEHYLYSQTSSMITTCVKTIPLSQTDGQRLLTKCMRNCGEILNKVKKLGLDDLCLSTPGFDIRCMQHEGLYSRLYMS